MAGEDFLSVTGIVLKAQPVGESDRRITILTSSKGKIGAFARGARKPNSRFAAGTCSFAFGNFRLYAGRDSYNLADIEITNYFEPLRMDVEAAAYASYFAEIADYYGRENSDEKDMLKLLYRSLQALSGRQFSFPFVKCVFELKSIAIAGEYPGIPGDMELLDGTKQALSFIGQTPPEKIYSFRVSEEALSELRRVAEIYRARYMDHNFKSLEILNALC